MAKPGKVYLVGAGPGDPSLITLKACRLLERADVVVTDRLANPKLLEYAQDNAEIVDAGKSAHDHHLTQDQIIETIIDRARKGKTVVRLKGGDPFVFGRGGEEAEALVKAGIEFEIVPGITSAIAVPAYAGIPVTSRSCATSFAVITGHEADGKPNSSIKWDKIATGVDTLVVLMGVESLSGVVEKLIANGRSADTPVAVIQWGTHPSQRTVTGTLADIAEKSRKAGLTAPAVTVIGEVVKLRETLSWFEKKPLFGKRVIVTRAPRQASLMSRHLTELGADVCEIPVIKFAKPGPAGRRSTDAAIERLSSYDWIVFTSANGVELLVTWLERVKKDVRAMGSAKLAAIGPKTWEALRMYSLHVDFVPTKYVAEAVVEQFPEDLTGKRVLIPRAKDARDALPDGLRARGAIVDVAHVYETVPDTSHEDELREKLREGAVDVVTFTSASTVRNFLYLAGEEKLPKSCVIACIGPITAEAARAHGLEPHVIADEYTIEGLADALVAYFTKAND